jgi:hypothetical protein
MPTNNGQIVVNDGAGSVNGYFLVNSPYLINTHVRGVALHPSVLSALRSGLLRLRFGTLLGIDKADARQGYKVVKSALTGAGAEPAWFTAASVLMANTVGGVFNCFQTADSPDVGASGKSSIVDASGLDITTDMVTVSEVGGAAPAVGDILKAQAYDDIIAVGSTTTAASLGIFGAFKTGGAAGAIATFGSLGIITRVDLNVPNPNAQPGDPNASVTVIHARIKGNMFGQA